MRKVNITEFKNYLTLFHEMIKEGMQQDPEYEGEADDLLAAILRLEKELDNIHSEEDMDEKKYERIYPDLVLVSDCFNQITEMMGNKNQIEFENREIVNESVLDFEIEKHNEFQQVYTDWVKEFKTSSPQYKQLSKKQQKNVNLVLGYFILYIPEVSALDPTKWNEDTLEEICLGLLPEEVAADSSFFEDLGPILIAFFSFLSQKQVLEHAEDLIEYLTSIQGDIPEIAQDPMNWDFPKTIMMGHY